MAAKSGGFDPNLGKTFLREHGPLAIVRASSSRPSSSEEPSKYQDAQRSHDEQMPDVPPRLPDAPKREQFPTQDEFDEARAGWMHRVGKIKAMGAKKAGA